MTTGLTSGRLLDSTKEKTMTRVPDWERPRFAKKSRFDAFMERNIVIVAILGGLAIDAIIALLIR
jgi:hypothetical protein